MCSNLLEKLGVSSEELEQEFPKARRALFLYVLTEPTEAECFEAEQELLFGVHFRQLDREIRKMIEQDKQKGAKNTEQANQPDSGE